MITQDTVKYIASLARLHLDDAETKKFSGNLEEILHYVEQLNRLDVQNIKPTSHVLDVENVFRDDAIAPSLSNVQALGFAIEKDRGCYKVPKIID